MTSWKSRIEEKFNGLISFRLFKAWNIFAARFFYFVLPGTENDHEDGDCRLMLECPWRMEHHDGILVGSEDYGVRATGNLDPGWNPNMQRGTYKTKNFRKCSVKVRRERFSVLDRILLSSQSRLTRWVASNCHYPVGTLLACSQLATLKWSGFCHVGEEDVLV